MLSTMQDVPLQIRRILEHGAGFHATSHVTTAVPDGFRHARYDTVGANAARLAHALAELGIGAGDRVATFMWNNQQHVEAYYAVPCMGAVLHPLNIRLGADQVAYIANHAEDRVVIVDASLLPVFVPILRQLKTVEHVIVNGSIVDASTLDGALTPVHDYGQLIAGRPDRYPWPDVDERAAAAMCYTSGTTGEPKGVVYSHRSIYLHALGVALPDLFDLSAADQVLAVVPQFHVLAWGLPYSAFVTGAGLAMPDRFLAAEPLAEFIAAARPNKAAGVPTVWQALLHHVDSHPGTDISSLKEIIVGGSACPPALMDAYEHRHRITLLHAWGMTEMSPLGTLSRPPAAVSPDLARRYRQTQGRFPASVEPRLVGPDGEVVPNDGVAVGELEVRGPWITGRYHGDAVDPAKFSDGWLRTGDIGSISPDGYLTLTDRAKDVIKSGGEWISSVELENHLMAHPSVLEACVVGVPDEHWGERPLATVVLSDGTDMAALRQFLAERVPKWQLPERWALIAEVPKTSVGKFDKKVLRHRYAEGELPVQVLA
ncbi:MAG: long-chain fatty acid--CoA ligase [Actinobacteria bacterium 13_1_20CM_3_71_11]|nr:MAG: long-chain fatty acid--CoA ligase [Actinobacteria bacterium 13_1_20CM_3_71_11]